MERNEEPDEELEKHVVSQNDIAGAVVPTFPTRGAFLYLTQASLQYFFVSFNIP
jgi:hypothetical protein